MPVLLKNVGCRGVAALSTTLQLVEGTSFKFWAPSSARGTGEGGALFHAAHVPVPGCAGTFSYYGPSLLLQGGQLGAVALA